MGSSGLRSTPRLAPPGISRCAPLSPGNRWTSIASRRKGELHGENAMQARSKRDPKNLIVRGRCFLSVLGAACLAAASLASAPPATATVTIGQLSSSALKDCSGDSDLVQPSVTSGAAYVVPYAGTITS